MWHGSCGEVLRIDNHRLAGTPEQIADDVAEWQKAGMDGINRAAQRLARALNGKGAFRRFRNELHDEYPKLLPFWHKFSDARANRRAVEWLADNHLIDRETADRFYAEHPDPDLP